MAFNSSLCAVDWMIGTSDGP